ncbi:DEAD/DEAH box helicase [Blastopirellula marina]|uniref:DEAD/DEAH box helicase n=1 Tax=Blastopirellula marina TaxID=124 RepID=A0A2S8FGL1_9BACT|nr:MULTISPECIES: DEAD/DEAH box helicase family protein [Pirellulaceae]PQO31311.1 DEAD/DEAH box helicase [Blastopirellula marina]RCS51705.1 DEAD/DEAH box helicase [Bremerella cremea]
MTSSDPFPSIKFRGQLRPSQVQVRDVAQQQLSRGERQLHIVAPPGSGKTVVGLYLWAEMIKRPALVLSPNSAIQSQWAARTDLFETDRPMSMLVSTSPDEPKLLTSLTYQAVTLPRRGDDGLDHAAMSLWEDRLISKGQAQDPAEAKVWIRDLKKHNRDYYDERLSAYRKSVRDEAGLAGESFEMLHQSCLRTWQRLRDEGVGLLILDECHHLVGHWGRVLSDAMQYLDDPIVVGLTATPPDGDGKVPADFERYQEFLGPIDHDVPVPAVVRDGFLAPYQDLVYFVRPSEAELRFVAQADDHLEEILQAVTNKPADNGDEEPAAEVAPVEEPEADEPEGEELKLQHLGGTEAVYKDEDNPFADLISEEEVEQEPPAQPEPPSVVETVDEAPRVKALIPWLVQTLETRRHATSTFKTWSSFHRRDPDFADSARVFLQTRHIELPAEVPPVVLEVPIEEVPQIPVIIPVLDRYVRHGLRRSANAEDRALADRVISGLRMLGVQITETGCQACASPVGRVLAYSSEKAKALVPILTAEMAALGDAIRAVVVTDFEKTAATISEVEHLLSSEAGGAIAAFRVMVNDPKLDELDPILVTGSSVLVDDDLSEKFEAAAKQWLADAGYDATLTFDAEVGFHVVSGSGRDWCPRVYVEMITDLFQRGLTKCLVGTRGLLGEGWDANKINVLIDLTTVTTSMTVRQLRGRSFRLDPQVPEKLADNWDVVCLAPEFSKGLDDYARFIKKHQNIFGVTDDAVIEKGVGHVHPALTDLRPELLEGSVRDLNRDMLSRVTLRRETRDLWQIGTPYEGTPNHTLEMRIKESTRESGGFPPFAGTKEPWSSESLVQAIGESIARTMVELKMLKTPPEVVAKSRAGGYVRVLLEDASDEDSRMFVTALHEALGPLNRPRYIIPRKLKFVRTNWLSRMLPKMLGQYLEKSEDKTVMVHAVPNALAKNKETVEVYERYWNEYVSPGFPVFALRGEGEDLMREALKKGMSPEGDFHEKEIFR